MVYLALLRGINVGGNNIIEMKKLRASFEAIGLKKVTTYINTGNIIFEDSEYTKIQLTQLLENTISQDFGLSIKVLLKNFDEVMTIATALPQSWENNSSMKSDVMFLWEEFDSRNVVSELSFKPDIDTVLYVPGAILWSVSRENQSKSGMNKLMGTKLYSHMTIRNCNTARKVFELMREAAKQAG